MPKLTLLDPNKTGRQAEDLENKLRHLVVGRDEAIHQIVTAYQTHPGCPRFGGQLGTFCFLALPAPERPGLSRPPPSLC